MAMRGDSFDEILDAPRLPFLTGEQKDDWSINGQQFTIKDIASTDGSYGKRWEMTVEALGLGDFILTFPFGSWHTSRISKLRDLIQKRGPQGPAVLDRIELETEDGREQRTYWLKRPGMLANKVK